MPSKAIPSVPSKTYSILAAGRPVVASVDEGTEVARVVEKAGAGTAVPPDDPDAFTAALADLLYWPGDVVKNIVAAVVAVAVHRAFPGLLERPAVQRLDERETARIG